MIIIKIEVVFFQFVDLIIVSVSVLLKSYVTHQKIKSQEAHSPMSLRALTGDITLVPSQHYMPVPTVEHIDTIYHPLSIQESDTQALEYSNHSPPIHCSNKQVHGDLKLGAPRLKIVRFFTL